MTTSRHAALKVRALRLLAQREHSRAELHRKLLHAASHPDPRERAPEAESASREDGAAEVDSLLDWLEQRGYLSSERFVQAHIGARSARFGNRRIEADLRRHGLAPDRESAQSLAASEQQRALDVWARKFGALASDAAGRARQARFLTQRGFSTGVVLRVVRFGAQLHEPDRNGSEPEAASGSDASTAETRRG